MKKFPRIARATALALFAMLLVPSGVKAVDCTIDLCGFSAGQATGLRDTFVDAFNTETIAGNKTLSGTTVISGTTTLSGATTASGTFDATSTFSLGGTAVTATAAEINRQADTSARIVTATASTLAITEALHDGKIITLDRAGGIAVTMPEATGSGMVITFIVITKFTTDGTITLADTTNTALIGQASIVDSDTTDLIHMFTPGSTFDLVTLDGTNTGGGLGCWIQYIDLATDVWSVQIVEGVGGTAPATPFSST